MISFFGTNKGQLTPRDALSYRATGDILPGPDAPSGLGTPDEAEMGCLPRAVS
jgi:hypothetical protein